VTLRDVVPDPMRLIERVRSGWPPPGSRSGWLPAHSENHWKGVAWFGLRLLEAGCPADPAALFVFSVVHDAERVNDWYDDEHAARAADLAATLRDEGLIRCGDEWFDALLSTLREHDLRRIATCPTVGACFDSDRLALPRYGVRIERELMSTEQGRELICEAEALGPVVLAWPELIERFDRGHHQRDERYEQDRRTRAERMWEELNRPPEGAVFFHGGPVGLKIGDRVLPGTVTGAPRDPDSASPYRRDLSYVSVNLWACLWYVGPLDERYESGAVYEVLPAGPLEPDIPGLSWGCQSAEVIRVVRGGLTADEVRVLVELCYDAIDRLKSEGVPRLPQPAEAVWDEPTTIENWPPPEVNRVICDLMRTGRYRVDPELTDMGFRFRCRVDARPTYVASGSDDAP
jgi:uncharacterized protein